MKTTHEEDVGAEHDEEDEEDEVQSQEEGGEDEEEAEEGMKGAEEPGQMLKKQGLDEEEEEEEEENEEQKRRKERRRKKLLREIKKAERRGVCYLSRIPPHLKPLKLRHLLSQYAEVLRIYLAPEDPAVRLRRKMAGKDSGKNFTEGWVEFADKTVARRVAEMLNGEPMGGKRRSAYFYDLWNIKYLKKFKWDNLTEEIAYRNAVREQKQAADISAAKRERDFYLSKVDRSKAIAAMEERKNKRLKTEKSSDVVSTEDDAKEAKTVKVVRNFPQKKAVSVDQKDAAPRLSRAILSAVLGRSNTG